MSVTLRSWDRYDFAIGSSTEVVSAPIIIPSPSWIVTFFHSFPHLKKDFSSANSTFKLDNHEYRESLLLLIAAPIIWLLLTLFVFLVYFCVRCCQACCKFRNVEKAGEDIPKGGSTCHKLWLIVFIVLCISAMGVGFYGNEEVSWGSRDLFLSIRGINQHLLSAKAQVKNMNNNKIAKDDANKALQSLIDAIDSSSAPRQEKNRMKEVLMQVKKDVRTKQSELRSLSRSFNEDLRLRPSMRSYFGFWRSGEDFRWLASAAFFLWTVFVILILIIGLVRRSKCCLFAFAALATITVVLAWTIVAAYLGVAVGAADLCHQPRAFIRDYGDLFYESKYNRFLDVLDCPTTSSTAPHKYLGELETVAAALHRTKAAISDVESRFSQFMTSKKDQRDIPPLILDVKATSLVHPSTSQVIALMSLLECSGNRHLLLDGLHGLCHKGINGIALLLLGSCVLGLSLSVLVLVASCAWRRFDDDDETEEVQENDPFLAAGYASGPHYMSRRYQTESPEPAAHHRDGRVKQTTVADVSVSSATSAASRNAASNPTYSEHPMTSGSATPPLNAFSGSRTPPPPYGHSSSHHDSIYPSAPVL